MKKTNSSTEENNILIIEDSEPIRKYLKELLCMPGYQIYSSSTGEKALKMLLKKQFNLVVLDLMLPGLNGKDILKEIRNKYALAELPVIVVSADEKQGTIHSILEMGANDYITKPFNDLALKIKVKNLLLLQETNSKLTQQFNRTHGVLLNLKESEENCRYLSNLTFEGIVIHCKGIALEMNGSLAQMFGYKREELLHQNILDKLVYPDDLEIIRENIAKQYALPYEVRGKRKNGEIFHIEIETRNTTYKNQQARVAAVRDITLRKTADDALKQEKHTLKTILDNLPDIIAIQKPDHTIISYNKKGYEALGKPPDEVDGKKCYELLGKPIACVNCPTRDAIQSGKPKEVEKFVPELNMWVNALSIPIANAEGNIQMVIEKIQDITGRKTTENKIKTQNKELVELNDTKDRLFSIIGHDLKNPLNNIILFAELMGKKIDGKTNPKIKLYQHSIYNSAVLIHQLLENLLNWANTQKQEIVFRPKEIQLAPFVEEVLRLFSAMRLDKSIELIIKVPPSIFVFADQDMLATILRNLASNAIKFSNAGGVIQVEADEHKKYTSIAIVDSGVGIPEDKQKNIFDPLKNTSTPGTQNERGSGLGMFLCKQFIEKHGGKLAVTSTLGKGTTITFTLKKQSY